MKFGGQIFLIIRVVHNTYSISSYKFYITRIEFLTQPYGKTYCHLCLMSYVVCQDKQILILKRELVAVMYYGLRLAEILRKCQGEAMRKDTPIFEQTVRDTERLRVGRDSVGRWTEDVPEAGWYQDADGTLYNYDGVVWDEVPKDRLSELEFLG